MRLLTYWEQQRLHLGILHGDRVLDLVGLSKKAGRPAPFIFNMSSFLGAGAEAIGFAAELFEASRGNYEGHALKDVRLGPPVPKPGKIIAVGLNYLDHAKETDFKRPGYPLIFAKFPNSISGPHDPIVIPSQDMQVDSEAELAVIIGRRGKAIAADSALDYVAGYMLLNDVSARKWQFSDQQWTRGKSCDTFCPTGPWLTTRDDVPNPHSLYITGRLNGQVLQDSNTSKLIFRIPELIAFISAAITLEPGDIIATGTPSGVGVFRDPPVFLKPGDVAEVEIETLGTLKNPAVGPHSL